MRLIALLILLLSLSPAKVYLFPADANEAKNDIIELIDNSKDKIVVAMYNFSYGKFAKALVQANERGVKVTVILDKKKSQEKSSEYYYLKNNGVHTILVEDKMHMKVALFDKKTVVIGSPNWTKASFKENFEIITIENNKKYLKKVNSFLSEIIK